MKPTEPESLQENLSIFFFMVFAESMFENGCLFNRLYFLYGEFRQSLNHDIAEGSAAVRLNLMPGSNGGS